MNSIRVYTLGLTVFFRELYNICIFNTRCFTVYKRVCIFLFLGHHMHFYLVNTVVYVLTFLTHVTVLVAVDFYTTKRYYFSSVPVCSYRYTQPHVGVIEGCARMRLDSYPMIYRLGTR